MAVVYRSDIERVNQYAENALSKENEESQKLIDKINDFIGESSALLKGAAWDRERERFSTFVTALEKRKVVANSLLSSIKSANQIMENYINNFPRGPLNTIPMEVDMVDSAWAPQLQSEIDKANQIIAQIENAADDTNVPGTNEGLDYYYKLIAICEKQIAYINKMSQEDARAYAEYDAVISEMADLESAVEDVNAMFKPSPVSTPASPVHYAPSGGYGSYNPLPSGNSGSNDSAQPANEVVSETPVASETSTQPIYTEYGSYSNQQSKDEPSYANETITTNVIDNNISTQNVDIGGTSTPSQTITPSTTTTDQIINPANTSGNSTLRNVGLATAGLAAAGAAAYGGYKTVKKMKENNDFDEEEDFDGNDDNNTEINLSDDI